MRNTLRTIRHYLRDFKRILVIILLIAEIISKFREL